MNKIYFALVQGRWVHGRRVKTRLYKMKRVQGSPGKRRSPGSYCNNGF